MFICTLLQYARGADHEKFRAHVERVLSKVVAGNCILSGSNTARAHVELMTLKRVLADISWKGYLIKEEDESDAEKTNQQRIEFVSHLSDALKACAMLVCIFDPAPSAIR